MKITRIAVAALLALGISTVGTSADADPSRAAAPPDFWFICC